MALALPIVNADALLECYHCHKFFSVDQFEPLRLGKNKQPGDPCKTCLNCRNADNNYKRFPENKIRNHINTMRRNDQLAGVSSFAYGDKYIDADYIEELKEDCDMRCYYCSVKMTERPYRPNSMTYERLNNSFNHCCENVVLSCCYHNMLRGNRYELAEDFKAALMRGDEPKKAPE